MSTRRDARECAVQILFMLDVNPVEPDRAFRLFWPEKEIDATARAFAESIVRGVASHRAEIDGLIAEYAENWRLSRMAVVDRNVLRMAVYELMHRADIPPAVVINEAVDIVKYFNSRESGRFVNGILDRIRKELPRRGPRRESDA